MGHGLWLWLVYFRTQIRIGPSTSYGLLFRHHLVKVKNVTRYLTSNLDAAKTTDENFQLTDILNICLIRRIKTGGDNAAYIV